MGGNREALQKEQTIETFVLVSHRCLESTPNPTPPPSIRLCLAQALAHVGEYVQVVCALVPSTPTAPSDEITGVLHLFHPPT
jgi:hypothetical protein